MDDKSNTEMILNYQNMKETIKQLKNTHRKLLFTVMRASEREEIIDVLKKLKIIKVDWEAGSNKYMEGS